MAAARKPLARLALTETQLQFVLDQVERLRDLGREAAEADYPHAVRPELDASDLFQLDRLITFLTDTRNKTFHVEQETKP